jgi:hypothetical protein
MKNMYNENHKTLKKIFKTWEDGKNSNIHEPTELILLKWPHYQIILQHYNNKTASNWHKTDLETSGIE